MSDKITLSFPNRFLKSIHISQCVQDIICPMKTSFQTGSVIACQPPNPSFPCLSSLFFPNTHTFSAGHTQASLCLLMAPSSISTITPLSPLCLPPVALSFYLSLLILLSSLILSSHSLQIPQFLSVSVCISLCPQTSENQVILLEFCVLLCLSQKRGWVTDQCRGC